MDDFLNIISFENLYKAHRRARLSKRHKKEVILFEANLSENLWKLHYDLKFGKYEVGGYHSFMIYDPKEREIQAIGYRDRILQHSLCDNYLMPLLNRYLIYDNVACRKNKGTSFAIKRWRHFMAEHYKNKRKSGFFVKIDVKKYFPSISHSVLKDKLIKICKNPEILKLLFQIIDSYNFEENRGLPMGNQTSQCFALFFLNDLDKFIKEKMKIKYYVRYMDDILVIAENKIIAQQGLKQAETLFNKFLLTLNRKSQIFPIKNGVTFLGWHFYYDKNGGIVQKIKSETKKRIIKKITKTNYCFNKNMGKLGMVKASYVGYLQNGNSFAFLKKLKVLLYKNCN